MNKTRIFSTLLFFNFIAIFVVGQDNFAEKAFQLFDIGKYAEAEPLFKQLLDEKPDLLMLNYYYGACRTENGFFAEKDLNYLLKSSQGETPAKIDYYFGIQYQARNSWEQALKHYNKFRLKATYTEKTELKLAEKIQQCFNYENPFSVVEIIKTEEIQTAVEFEEIENPEKETIKTVLEIEKKIDKPVETNDTLSSEPGLNVPPFQKETQEGIPIEFRINNRITYLNTSHFRSEEAKKLFENGNSKQNELDFTLKKADELRKKYLLAKNENEKNIVGEKILSFEKESYKLKDEITQQMLQARTLEIEFWQNAPTKEVENFIAELEKEAEQESVSTESEMLPDTTISIDPNILFANTEMDNLISEQPETDELIYKIQVGAFSRGLPNYIDRLFKKLSLIRKIENYTDENGVVVYTTGNLTNMKDALKMQNQIKQEGVEDAFVVPYFNGKRITLKRAKEIAGEL